ncbi:MAG TPA: YCF48-related protein [Bacteroidales bacterium]
MKKFLLTLSTLLIIYVGNTFSQTWEQVTSGTSFILYGMSFPPNQNDVGYACGMQYTNDSPGVIIKTVDGGETWSTILPVSGEISGLETICFTSTNTGYAAGWDGYFIKTTDGGTTWTEETVGSDIWYYSNIVFWDEDNGVVAANTNSGGTVVYITDDAGTTWTTVSGFSQILMRITYASENVLFATGNAGQILKSVDGGLNWSSVYQASGITFGVSFANANFGVVGGEDGKIFSTTNGGASWNADFSTGYHNFYATAAFSGDSAFMGGTDADLYRTLDAGQSWAMNYNGTASSTLYKVVATPNRTMLVCGSQGVMYRRAGPLSANFSADQTTVCEGGTVNFIDESASATSWSWTFEGGTPATSTEQNPSVVYSNVGVYDVSLTVSDGQGNSTLTKNNYIIVITGPGQAATPSGDEELCSGLTYEYSTNQVIYAASYEWVVTPTAAGTFIGNGTTVDFEVSDSWSGDFTIKVRAVNNCAQGEWSDDLSGTVNMSPAEFDLSGSGEICEGDPGIEITLSGSEVGVDYELFNNEGSTGIILAGTGNSLSFGVFTEQNNYTAVGFTATCSTNMIGEGSVLVNQLPEQLTTPSGTTEVCNDSENEYTTTNAQNSDNVVWTLSPANAGTIESDGMTATISWNSAFEGTASLTVLAENSCGTGPVSGALEILVFSSPSPEITGTDMVCKNHEETYSTIGNEGNTYGWEVIGGTITEGEGTHEISVLWGDTPGMGYVILNESLEFGCSAVDSLFVTIDDCTGVFESNLAKMVSLHPNPASNSVNITSETQIISIIIYNTNGKIIEQIDTNSKTLKLNTSKYISGIYFVRINAEQGSQVKRLIIK